MEFKDRLNTAFKELRRMGFVARQNFLCCQTCAGSVILEKLNEAKAKGRMKAGYVYYHRQDADDLKEYGDCYLAFGSGDPDSSGKQDRKESKKVGFQVVEVLNKAGITTKWDGNPNTRIQVVK